MGNEGTGLNYKVTVSGASQGAAEIDRLAGATDKVAGATSKAAPQAKGLAEALASLGSRNNPAKDALEGLSTAARGGEGSIFGLTKAFRAFRELANGGAAALGPVGIIVAGLGLLVGLLPRVIDLFKSFGDTAEKAAKRTEAAVTAAEKLGQLKLEGITKALEKISESSDKAKSQLQQLTAAAERVDDAKKAAALAKIDANDKLDDNQKAAAKALVEDAARKKSDQRKLQELQGIAAIDQEALGDVNSKVADAKSQEASARKKVLANNQLTADIDERDALTNKFLPTQKDEARRMELNRQLGDKKKPSPAMSELAKKELETSSAETDRLTKEQAKAQKEAEKSQFSYDLEKRTQAEINPEMAVVETAKLLPIQRKIKQQAQAAGLRAQTAAENEDWAGQSEAVGDRKKAISDGGAIANAAKKIADAPTIKGDDLSKSVDDLGKNIAQNANQSQEAITKAASAISESAGKLPPAVNLAPVVEAQQTYHGVVMERFSDTNRSIQELRRQIQQMAQQMAASRS